MPRAGNASSNELGVSMPNAARAFGRGVLSRRFATAGMLCLTFGASASWAQTQTPLTVQVINDSGHNDYNVFLLLGGQSITLANKTVLPLAASGINTVDTGATTPSGKGGPLGCTSGAPTTCTKPLAQASVGGVPLTVNSPYSGTQNLPVYQFTASTVGSGTLYVSYDTPITYTSAPTIYTQPRWQLFEMSYSASIASVGDLTSIDFFGIPMEVTTYASGDTAYVTPQAKATYYSSTLTLLNALASLNSNMTLAMLDTSGNTFTPGVSSMSNFARVVGPNQMSAPGSTVIPSTNPSYAAGSPFPYPSFADYLDSLVAQNYTFVEQDQAVISAYVFNYTGSITGNRTSGYQIVLTGTTTAPSGSGLPSNAQLTLTLPPQGNANGGFDFYVYGAVQNCDSMSVAGFACDTTTTLPTMANSVYGWMQADVMSALNFGYMNGRVDKANATYNSNVTVGNSASWYGLPPMAYPFGAARTTNDGYYNPWAAVMYNQSDAYGFAFSDRNGRPSPGIALPTGGTLRIWLLPDGRLDAPLINTTGATCTAATAGSCSVSLQWQPSAGATEYDLVVTPPYTGTTYTVQPPTSGTLVTQALTNLDPGTNYTVTATAVKKGSGTTTRSTTLQTQVAMPGTPPAPAAGSTSFVLGFNWNVPSYPQLPPLVGPTMAAGSGVLAVASIPSAVQMSFAHQHVKVPGASRLTVTVPNPSAGSSALTQPFVVSFNPPVSAFTNSGGDCPGVQMTNGQIVMPTGTVIPYAGCTLTVGVHFAHSDVYVATTSAYQLANGISQPPSGALVTAGTPGSSEVTLTPALVAPGTASTLAVLLPNTGAVFNTLTAPYVVTAPAGTTFTALTPQPAPPCPFLVTTATSMTLPAGTAIPPGSGCYIGVSVTATADGAYDFSAPSAATVQMQGPTLSFAGGTYTYNGAGGYGFASGTRPAINTGTPQALPLQISIGSTVLWSDMYYFDFVGSSTSFTVPIGAPSTPNFLVRSSGVLTVNGVPGTPPYSTTAPNQANIGTAFAPIPDKLFWPVAMPGTQSAMDRAYR